MGATYVYQCWRPAFLAVQVTISIFHQQQSFFSTVQKNKNFSADYNLLHSQAGARNAVDDPGGSVDGPGGGIIDDKGSFCDPSTSTSTSPKTSASFVTSSLTNRVSLLSLSDKSTVDMIGTTDYATGSFCSSCSIQPTLPGRFWLDGMGCAMCSYDYGG